MLQNNQTDNEKLENVQLNELKSQILRYHQNNHETFNQTKTKTANVIYVCSMKCYDQQKLTNISGTVKPIDLASNLANIELISSSVFTRLTAPCASIDGASYQISEFSSLSDINNNLNQQQTRENSFKYNEKILDSPRLTINSAANKMKNYELGSLEIENILDECTICKEFTLTNLNSKRFINLRNHLVANEANSLIRIDKQKTRKKKPKDSYCMKCFCFCCYDSLISSQFYKALTKKRNTLKRFVDGKFNWAIIGAILINTLSMGIEHHNQVNSLIL